jgi:glycosyltransferase involved in cell wall biosynthesis
LHDLQLSRAKNELLSKKSIFNQKIFVKKFQKSESQRLQQCDLAISISSIETKKIKRLYKPRGKLVTIPASNYMYKSFNFTKKYKYDLLFVGSNSSSNVDAISWFLNNCFGAIVAKFSNITFLIQGNVVNNRSIAESSLLKQYSRNLLLGKYAPSLRDIYDISRLVISPIRYGTGMKIKIVEALSYGKAIVATSIALEGIDTMGLMKPQDEAHNFILECIRILDNDCLQKQREDASKLIFDEKHSFKVLKNKLKQSLHDLG